MELLKSYGVVITLVLIVLVLVVIRSTGINHFKNDARKMAEPSVTHSNTITTEQAGSLKGNNLTINLDNKMIPGEEITGDLKNIPADSILDISYLRIIRKHNGPTLLFSIESSVSSRIWMVLSQMGLTDLYILTDSTGIGVLKYKFRPDTLKL